MEKKKEVGLAVKELANLLKRYTFGSLKPESDVTMMQGWIIGFLCSNSDRDMFQKDIEQRFEIRRSTATSMLQLMEKNGYITRHSVDYDARLKKICITEKAKLLHKSILDRIEATEKQMLTGISNEELDAFFSTIEKMKNNIKDKQLNI